MSDSEASGVSNTSPAADALVRQPVAAPQAELDDAPPPTRAKSRLPWLIGGIVLAVLLLAGAGTAAFLLLTPTATNGPSAAVVGYDQAYADVDCELFVSVTTDAYREALAPTCADFEAEAQAFVDNFSEYEVVIDSTTIDGSTATIVTTESWVLEGQENTVEYTYTLVDQDGSWRIDAIE